MRERKVYLPAGADWTEWETGKVWPGGAFVQVEAPVERIPVFLKNGAKVFADMEPLESQE